ncbi:MAG: hypothetical protein ACI4RA_09070 [Kiritimatiellia bacterium]
MTSRVLLVFVAVWLAAGSEAYTVYRSFRHGYPSGSVSGKRPETGATTGASIAPVGRSRQTTRTTTRTISVRLVKDPGGDFAVKAVRGEPVLVELKEPKGCRWGEPPKAASHAVIIERGGAAKQRSKGASGGPETALVTLRRLSDGNADVVLTCRRTSAPKEDTPVRTITIRLVAP